MALKHIKISEITITVFFQCLVLCLAIDAANEYCTSNTAENGSIVLDCSCPLDNEILILKDATIGNGTQDIALNNLTTHLRIGDCYELHLSGSMLLNLTNLKTFELHNIEEVHVDINFFSHYYTQMEVFRVSRCHFSGFEGSLNIEAHKLREIIFNEVIWDKQFNLLLHTEDNHTMDLISIRNSHMETLEQINISTRQVNHFLLENNTIGIIWTSAILLKSNFTTITENTIDHLNLLSMDLTTYNFTLSENTIKFIELQGIRVNNASFIQINGNTFYHIEKNAFLWIQPKENYEETVIISNNQFRRQDRGSLLFARTIYKPYLQIQQNAIYSTTCGCNTLQLLEAMTEADNDTVDDYHKHRRMTYILFHDTSVCIDQNGNAESISFLCTDNKPASSWFSVTISVMIISTICIALLLYIQKRYKCIRRGSGPLENQQFNPFNYSANLAYNDDSETEEYVRKANHTL